MCSTLYHGHRNTLTVEDDPILWGEALIISLSEREKILQAIHKGHMGISKCQDRVRYCVYWPRINSDIKCLVESHTTCQCHHPQEPQQLFQPILAPECPWQLLGADYFHFDRSEYLVVTDYYSKMPIIRRNPASQCNVSKTISVLKELFAEHSIPEVLHTDNGPQFANALFKKFATDWKFDHNTSSPMNPWSNGQAEAAMKTVKGLLTHSKCSGQDPYLALLEYHSIPINAHLHSPAEMLYQQVLCTTVPQWIRHTDPHANIECDHLNQCATQSIEYHNQQGCCKKPPFFASKTVSVLNDARTLWLPATIIHKANNGSYLVQIIGSGQYRHAHDHIWECHPDAVKPDTSNIGDVAPAASTSACATQVLGLPTAVATTTPTPVAPAATLQTPCKGLPAVHLPQWTQTPFTGGGLSQTCKVPAVLCQSTQSRKPPSRILEEI